MNRMLVAEKWSQDRRRRAIIYAVKGSYVIECYENDALLNTPSTQGVMQNAEVLAESFCNGDHNPALICG